jgi:WD40 repeat protein
VLGWELANADSKLAFNPHSQFRIPNLHDTEAGASMSNDCPQTAELERLIRGRITEARAAVLTEHIGFCPDCQDRMESLAAGGDKLLTTTVRACRMHQAPKDSALWPALSAVAEEVASTGVYSKNGDTDLTDRGSPDLNLNFLHPSSDPALIGRIGGFDIKRVVGRGGMGVVLQGYDPHLQRDVAVKVLDPELADNAVARQRFCREARAAAAVTHDNLVAVYQVDELADSELPYLVMQLVVGESLEQRLKRVGKLGPVEVAKLGQQAAAGLAAAHAGGLIHRDIKPGNILLEEYGDRVKLTDFGLARGVEDVRLTRTGFVAGTPLYMAPEQAHGETVDHRSDLFSLGSVLYEAATGKHPFDGKTPLAVLRRVADETQPPLRSLEPATPLWLSDVIDRLLAKDAADRFQTAAEVAEIFTLELARSGIEVPGCGKASVYALKRKPICWKAAVRNFAPGFVGLAIGALAVGLWPSSAKPDPMPIANAATVDPGLEPKYIIPGEAGPVWAVGFTPDAKTLVFGTEDGSIQLWDLKDQKVRRTLKRSGGHIWNLDISTDGKFLVAPSDNLDVEIFSLEDYQPHRKFAPGASTKAAIFTPDEKSLITGDRSAAIRVWDWVDQIPYDLRGHKGTVHGLAVSPDSTQLASAGSDALVNVWNLANRKTEPESLTLHKGPVYSVAFSPNTLMPRMASAGWDGIVRIWNPKTLEQLHPMAGHEGDVFSVSFGQNGKVLASAGADGTVRVWDVESGNPLHVLRGSGRPFHSVRFGPDGTTLAAGGRDGNVRVWEIK